MRLIVALNDPNMILQYHTSLINDQRLCSDNPPCQELASELILSLTHAMMCII